MIKENLVELILNDYDSFVEYHKINDDIEKGGRWEFWNPTLKLAEDT